MNTKKPIISIIIPTYKTGDYILDCLMSISNQDCNFDLFEVLIILNGEENPHFEFIKNTIDNIDKKFNVKFHYIKQKGVSNARNYGLEKATGEYITFLDDDDYITPNYISDLYETLLTQNENEQKNTIVCSNLKTFNGEDFGEDYISHSFEKCSSTEYNIVKYRKFLSGIAGKLIPRQVIDEIKFRNKFSIGEDSIFLFELSKNINKMILTDKSVFYVRRIREGSAKTAKRSLGKRISLFINLSVVYTKIYFKAPLKYNFILYSTRMLAGFKGMLS